MIDLWNLYTILMIASAIVIFFLLWRLIRITVKYNSLLNRHGLVLESADVLNLGLFIIDDQNRLYYLNPFYKNKFHKHLVRHHFKKILLDARKKIYTHGRYEEIIPINQDSVKKTSYRICAYKLNQYKGYMIFTVEDISNILKISDSYDMRLFLDKLPVGIFSMNSEGEFLYVNRKVMEWLNCSLSNRNNLFKLLDNSDDKKELFPNVPDILSLKNHEHYFSINKQFYRTFQRFIKISNDEYVTCSILMKSKHNQEVVNIEDDHFKGIFYHAPLGILLVDQQGNILAANHKFSHMLRKHTSDLSGKKLEDFLTFACKQSILDTLQKIFSQEAVNNPVEISFKGLLNDDLAAYINPFKKNDKVVGAIIHFLSTSEEKKIKLQFIHSQRMQAVGQLAGGVAHDFNNLLTAMIGFCDLLLQRHSPTEQSFSDIMQIKQNATRAAGLVRQLLAFSRQQTLQPKIINITDVLSELSALLRRLLGPAIDLKVKHFRDLWFIKVDKGQFEQVVINLAVNARDAMDNKGILKITTENYVNKKTFLQDHDSMPPGEYVCIEIEDTGSGISQEIIGRIFEPFFSTKSVGSGTGLGLSTVYGIVKQTGGFIFVDSIIGKGTTFKIFLPRHIPKEQDDYLVPEEKHLTRDLTGTDHILLVEDEEAVRMFATRALKDKGYKIIEANNAEDAVEICKRDDIRIDLIITDVVLPGMDGSQMINEIRNFLPSVKVIFISGYAEDSFRKKLNNEDNIHFLPKPFNLKDLALKVKDILK